MASDDWFDKRKPAAVQKHGIVARYAPYFAGRAGKATNGQVAFVDGFAGEGRYKDQSPGSPLLLLNEAERARLINRHVQLEFVEAHSGRAAKLRSVLLEAGVVDPSIREAIFIDALPALREAIGAKATLYFVDPFSFGLPFRDLVQLLRSSDRQQPIDVIYHFSSATVARYATRIVKADDDDPLGEMPARLDAALGPDVDWRTAFEAIASRTEGKAFPLAVDLSREVAESASRQSGVTSTVVEVKPRRNAATIYTLALFSGDAKAHWDYADHAGGAHIDWLHRCDLDDYQANVELDNATGAMRFPMFEAAEPDRGDIDAQVGQEATRYLIGHLPTMLADNGPLRFIDEPALVYGDFLGRAREMHVRAAVKELHTTGAIADDGTGDFFKREIRLSQ